MDQLRAMRIFVRVIDERSFAGAARALDMTPPAVTRCIAELEEHLGSRLINRTTRSLSLTEVGSDYLERVRPILDDIDAADVQATAATGEVRGRLRVTGPAALLSGSVMAVLPEFQRRHEKVSVQLNVALPRDEPDENADVTLLVHDPDALDGDFIARLLAHSHVVLCATPDYLNRHGRPTCPDDLADHQVLVPDVPFVRKGWAFQTTLPSGDVETVHLEAKAARVTSHNPELLVSAARNGLGIAGSLSLDVVRDLRSGALERVLPQWHIATFQVYAAMPTRQYLPLRTRAFADFLVEKYGGRPEDPWLAGLARPASSPGL